MVVDLPLALPPSRQTIWPRPTASDRSKCDLHRAVEGVDVLRAAAAASRHARGLLGRLRAGCAMAEIGLDHLRVVAHVGGHALGDLEPVVHHDDAVGQLHHQVELVLDQQDGQAALLQLARSVACISAVSVWFMPAVGSSSSSRRGRSASARAISTRRRLA